MKKRILTLGIVLALVATMVVPVTALAGNQSGQQAATFSTTIEIVGKVDNTAVSQILFPPAAPGATVSNPWNDADDSNSPPDPPTHTQLLSASASEPVVRLYNNTGGDLVVWLVITDWTSDVVVSEDYELVDTTTTTVDVVNDVLSSDGNAATIPTGITINDGTYKALYLEVVLSGTGGLYGTSMLSILGTAP
jgi:hypothetical protein